MPCQASSRAYGQPALRCRGKVFAACTALDPGRFLLHVAADEKQVLLDTDPATFWETDHYCGRPAVLVRYGTAAGDRLAVLLARAWWDRATRTLRTAYGSRP